MKRTMDASFGFSKAGAAILCEGASTTGGMLGALGFIGLVKALEHTWDLQGVGQTALWGAVFGILVGAPITTIMSLRALKDRGRSNIRIGRYWAGLYLLIVGGLGSFLACAAWFVWCQ
jgi:hypothetical protein